MTDGSTLMPAAGAHEFVVFRASSIHGCGCFAAAAIPPGSRVIEYTGERITKEESRRRCEQNNDYIFAIDDACDLDGNVGWNPAKFINHSCVPNCEAQWIEGRLWIVSLRAIQPGEEVTFNYGYDLENYAEHPCRCGAPECAGYIVAETFYEHVRRRQAIDNILT